MNSEIENTPEHIKRAREEECPRLILAPFSRPPQIVFDNIILGTSCERNLEVLNPLKHIQQVTLERSLPPGLQINLPGEWLELEPETCYSLTMSWTPTQPTALRETLHFTDEKRGKFDVSVVLKSAMAADRGHLDCKNSAMHNPRAVELRRRWREGAERSSQPSQSQPERYADSMEVLNNFKDMESSLEMLNNFKDMESLIAAFKTIEQLTTESPTLYDDSAAAVVRSVYSYMSRMNRSVPCVAVLMSAASVLANLTRYHVTGPKIYSREHIPPLLKYMLRFITSEVQLFLILATYLWLYSKYGEVREDLTEYLHTPENHKMMKTIKRNVDRIKRMAQNASKHKPITPAKFNSSANFAQDSTLLPALEPDYGIARVDQQRYFIDPQQAMHCLFLTYKL